MANPETRVGLVKIQFGVNHMGHFALTTALIPLLSKTPEAGSSATSTAHKMSDIRWEDIQFAAGDYENGRPTASRNRECLFANPSRRLKESEDWPSPHHPEHFYPPTPPAKGRNGRRWLDQ